MKPSILIPYEGVCTREDVQDIVFYVRPETNSVGIESILTKKIYSSPHYHKEYRIVYLANIPGEFIRNHKIIEYRERYRLNFAAKGKAAWSDTMISDFEKHFNTDFAGARIINCFEALDIFGLTFEELFRIWVPPHDYIRMHDISIKKYQDCYILNYDLPFILHNNSAKTNVFVMILRSFFPYSTVHNLITEINLHFKELGIVTPHRPAQYVFHYSKGPFQQILDGIGYLYRENQQHIPLEEISFAHYLFNHGCRKDELIRNLENPILRFQKDNAEFEMNLFFYTHEHSYQAALEKYETRLR